MPPSGSKSASRPPKSGAPPTPAKALKPAPLAGRPTPPAGRPRPATTSSTLPAAGPGATQSLSVGGRVYVNAHEWAERGGLSKYAAAASRGAVAQRFDPLTTASMAITVLTPETAIEVTGVMAMNTPEKDKIGHVTVMHLGKYVPISELFTSLNISWKLEKKERSQPSVLSASRILSAMWYFWLETMGSIGRPLDGFSGRIGPMDIPSECVDFKLNIVGMLQKKEMCGLIDRYYHKEVCFIHFLHHFLITNNREKKVKFGLGVIESCFAQIPPLDSGSSRADLLLAAIPESLRKFIKFRNDSPSSGTNPNDVLIDKWFTDYNSGDRQNLSPSKPMTKEQHSFKEKIALSLLAN